MLRARVMDTVRRFFYERGVLEVTTPVLSTATAPERYQNPTRCNGGFLQTSPETAMKRLVAAGSGPIFQICPAFRDDEAGRLHNPEFTILEWYRPGWDYRQLLQEVEGLLQRVLPVATVPQLTFRQAFQKYVGIDPLLSPLEQMVKKVSDPNLTGLDRQGITDLLLVEQLEPALQKQGGGVFLLDYPPWDPAMAELDPGPPSFARRFELYFAGVELANGYQELTDAKEQEERLLKTNRQRLADGSEELPIDYRFLAALENGFPRCSGVALGIDRLVMLAAKQTAIAKVMTFPQPRC